jgi:hypothetical protein
MSGTTQRRHPATVVPVAALLLALLLSGLAAGRLTDPASTALRAALTATQGTVHEAAQWTGSRPARGKATAILVTAGSGLFAPGLATTSAVAVALLVVAGAVRRPRRRRIGRMHAGRGPPARARQPLS